jgi:hypothetical protein
LAFLTLNKAKLCKILIITLVFEKNANFFAENCRKSQKIVIITSTPSREPTNPLYKSNYIHVRHTLAFQDFSGKTDCELLPIEFLNKKMEFYVINLQAYLQMAITSQKVCTYKIDKIANTGLLK